MVRRREIRDSDLLDRLDALSRVKRSLRVWRVIREGRDPCQCGAPGGRWDDGTFDVLYTCESADGAIAEIWFHLTKGQPVFPTKASYRLFELRLELRSCIVFPDLEALAKIGVDVSSYGQLSHADRELEYPRMQEIAEHAHFLGADGLCVPSARWGCANFVVFCDQIEPGKLASEKDHGLVKWDSWGQQNARQVRISR
ncbi:MAG: RES family NAD+ phosphorylase [Devosia nanyangense]|uniref:RES family NAD+ phosphorylase n=1 Tax=Devosia nanyangense TaxID=1228055 RepID=A0A933NZ49_9HYPH|nr:RES family NAD+ phosphorylase [Devosia nanyangense]